MRKSLVWLFLILVIVAGMSPWIDGYFFKINYLKFLAAFEQINNNRLAQRNLKIHVNVLDYQSGWLTSRATISIEAEKLDASETPRTMQIMVINQKIQHGPYVLDPESQTRKFAQAMIETDVTIPMLSIIRVGSTGVTDFHANTLVTFANNYISHFSVPSYGYQTPLGKIVWDGLKGDEVFNMADTMIINDKVNLEFGAIKVQDPMGTQGTTGVFQPIIIQGMNTYHNGLQDGSVSLRSNGIIYKKNTNPNPIIGLLMMNLTSSYLIDNQAARVNRFKMDFSLNDIFSKIAIDFSMKNLTSSCEIGLNAKKSYNCTANLGFQSFLSTSLGLSLTKFQYASSMILNQKYSYDWLTRLSLESLESNYKLNTSAPPLSMKPSYLQVAISGINADTLIELDKIIAKFENENSQLTTQYQQQMLALIPKLIAADTNIEADVSFQSSLGQLGIQEKMYWPDVAKLKTLADLQNNFVMDINIQASITLLDNYFRTIYQNYPTPNTQPLTDANTQFSDWLTKGYIKKENDKYVTTIHIENMLIKMNGVDIPIEEFMNNPVVKAYLVMTLPKPPLAPPTNQAEVEWRQAYYRDMAQSTTPYGMGINKCFQKLGSLTNCNAGTNYIPAAITIPTKNINSLSVVAGVITLVPVEQYGILATDTYILTPTIKDGSLVWSASGGAVERGLIK